ncbi:hypothetical protein [Vogesella urethralis]|uniref:hypothetical protein n=1 Tax=Vogesella urethralis TaxID=2592656 RepID=UPI0011871DCF|nr:hypothetical protein [Vogesella urethralis]
MAQVQAGVAFDPHTHHGGRFQLGVQREADELVVQLPYAVRQRQRQPLFQAVLQRLVILFFQRQRTAVLGKAGSAQYQQQGKQDPDQQAYLDAMHGRSVFRFVVSSYDSVAVLLRKKAYGSGRGVMDVAKMPQRPTLPAVGVGGLKSVRPTLSCAYRR